MLHSKVPQYIVDAAKSNQMVKVLRVSVNKLTGEENIKEITVPAKAALKALTTDYKKRGNVYRKIRAIGEVAQKQNLLKPTILSDEELLVEMEKRGLLKEKPKGRPKKVESEGQVPDSLLSDPELLNDETND